MHTISQNDILIIGSTLYILLLILKLKIQKKSLLNIFSKRVIIKILFVIYIIGVISKVYFPLKLTTSGVNLLPTIHTNPIESMYYMYKVGDISWFLYQIIGNTLLLMPLPMFLGYFKRINLFNATIITILTTLFIECSQVFLSFKIPSMQRHFDINDIILNTLGGILGFILWKILHLISIIAKYYILKIKTDIIKKHKKEFN